MRKTSSSPEWDEEEVNPQPTRHYVPWYLRGKVHAIICIVLAAIILIPSTMFIVQPTEMAGERLLGKVATAYPLAPGLHFKIPLIETADTIQTSQSTYSLPDMQVYTVDNQGVHIGINVIYQIPTSSVLHLLYDVGRSGNVDIDATILPVVQDRALATFAKAVNLSVSGHGNHQMDVHTVATTKPCARSESSYRIRSIFLKWKIAISGLLR